MHNPGFDLKPDENNVIGTFDKIWIWTVDCIYCTIIKFPDKMVKHVKIFMQKKGLVLEIPSEVCRGKDIWQFQFTLKYFPPKFIYFYIEMIETVTYIFIIFTLYIYLYRY